MRVLGPPYGFLVAQHGVWGAVCDWSWAGCTFVHLPVTARSAAGTALPVDPPWPGLGDCAARPGQGLSGSGSTWDRLILRPEGDWLVWGMASGPVPSDQLSPRVCVPFRERLVLRRGGSGGCLQGLSSGTGRAQIPGSCPCWSLFVRHFI